MPQVFEVDPYSRKSRRHHTSGRRRTTGSDKYGHQIATLGATYSTGSDPVVHVLRVRPGVVINFIEAPSHSSRSGRSRTNSHTSVEYRSHGSYHRNNSRKYETRGEKESPWEITHSPHPRALELFDEWPQSKLHSLTEPEPLPPVTPLEIVRSSVPPVPPPRVESDAERFSPLREQHLPVVQRPAHSFPTSRSSEPHRESSVPVDIPAHSHPSDLFFHQSPTTTASPSSSITSAAPAFSRERALDARYLLPPGMTIPAPINIPAHISSSGRTLSRSLDSLPHHDDGVHFSESGSGSSPSTTRTVRFNDNPVEPSPAPVVRRKGWWNRRGDQLWDNDGSYARASSRDKYPLDLDNYPEPGVGWMNEDGLQIDTKRRLVRKKPLRSALKKPSSL